MNRKKRLFFAALILVLIIIFIFSNQAGDQSAQISDSLAETIHVEPDNSGLGPGGRPILFGLSIRKYAHIFLYIVMGIFVFLSLKKSTLRPVIAVGICYSFAALDELHQYFVPGRTALFSDTLIDALGFMPAILGCWGISILRERRKADGNEKYKT
ncbi:MAG: VanZ family protein [Coprococcus sp.]|nr:VanZ family protein [Coprococcus sp.]